MISDEEIRKLAEFAWDEDIKTNPSTPNPYSFVYGFRKGYKEAMEEYKSVPIVDDWISVETRLPGKEENGNMKPVLVLYERYKGKPYHRIAYYFPEHFKTIEWEDWDDYSEEDFPYTENDSVNGCVWLRPGFYDTVECDKCEGYWSAPLKVTHWRPLPTSPNKINK